MIYLLRFTKFLLSILTIIVKALLIFILGIIGIVQVLFFFFLFPVVLALQLVELILVPITYYTITGNNYYQDFNPIIFIYYMYGEEGRIILRTNTKHKKKEFDFYGFLFELIWKKIPLPGEYMNNLIAKYE